MKKRWFRFYIERWRDGVAGLTPNEIAVYMIILCELYDHDGFVVRPDYDLMARRVSMRPSSFRKAFDVLIERRKLSLEGEVLTSKAVSEEIKSREKLDGKSAESREKVARFRNEINEIRAKIPSNKEERIQNRSLRTLQGSSTSPPLQALEEGQPSAVAAFAKRREMAKRGGH